MRNRKQKQKFFPVTIPLQLLPSLLTFLSSVFFQSQFYMKLLLLRSPLSPDFLSLCLAQPAELPSRVLFLCPFPKCWCFPGSRLWSSCTWSSLYSWNCSCNNDVFHMFLPTIALSVCLSVCLFKRGGGGRSRGRGREP